MEQPYEGIYQRFDFQNHWVIRNGVLRRIKPSSYRRRINYQRSEEFLTSRRQQCTLKLSYSRKLKSHKDFLDRYLPQKNKSHVIEKPEIFGNISLASYKKKMVATNFKWIFSPEETMEPEIMKGAVKDWVKRLEFKTGHKFDWQAAIHTDTAHPHAHILINGVDKDGKGFRFSRNIVTSEARNQAQECLTNILGERRQELIDAANDRRIIADRFTEYDEFLQSLEKPVENDKRFGTSIFRMSDVTYQRRLEHLKDLGIAEYSDGKYLLEHNWQDTLKSLGRYNTFIDARRHLHGKEKYNLVLYTEDMGPIKGNVRFLYMMDDEATWSNAYVIQDKNGKGYFVPLFNPPDVNLLFKNVSLSLKTSQSGKLTPVVKEINDPDMDKEFEKKIEKFYGDFLKR